MPKYNNLCNWQPKKCCLVKPSPPLSYTSRM